MYNDIEKVLLKSEEIEQIVTKLAADISKDYENKKPILIGLLKGCEPFMSDLFKKITIPVRIDYMKVSSYAGKSSTGNLDIKSDISTDINGEHVIIVDDIIDTGRTTVLIKKLLEQRGAKSVKLCALLDKPEGRVVEVEGDYVGTTIPKEFVVGYGLDYNEFYRNLPFIGVLKEKVYN